uniref:RNA-dependent RNA polymerase n=1 Tax=Riboviria sp. TaxID=2585031 RepID=A0A8K1JEA5_9VIRU|nr:MAG: RNA-dependent RNA polymerase [Riboviria sp.]
MIINSVRTNWRRYQPTLKEIDQKILDYFRSFPSRPDNVNYQQALLKAREDFSLGPSKPSIRHVNDVIRYYPHPERSPGLPYTKLGIRQKKDVDTNRIRWNIHKLKYREIKKFRTPCSIAAKTVVALPDKDKFRVIWVYPVDMTIIEGMFAQPLIRAYNSRTRIPYAIWYRWHKRDMHLLNSMLTEGTTWCGLDYSAFDVNVPAWIIRDAFSILKEQLNFKEYEFYGRPTDPETIENLWTEVVKYFINTPAKLKSGKIVVKHSGVPSGSYFTNLIDSVVNSIMIHYILLTLEVRYYDHFFMGDDCLIRIGKEFKDLDAISRIAQGTFGAKINGDKSEIGRYVQWLGYKLGPQFPGIDYDKVMAQLLLPSKRDLYPTDIYVRARAIFISSFCDATLRTIFEEHGLLREVASYKSELIDRLNYIKLYYKYLHKSLIHISDPTRPY